SGTRRHSAAGVAEPWPGRRSHRSKSSYPATPHQPRIASPIASGSPSPLRCCGELLKPPAGPGTSRLSASGGQQTGARSAPFPAVIGSISHRENGLPVRVLDLSRPGLLDVLHDTLRHRNIVEFLCHLAPVLVGPSEELERLTCCGCITRLLVDENPGHSGHRP